jgi:hypothetical protein
VVARLRLPLDAAADFLVLVEPALAAFERQAALVLERAPLPPDPSYGGIFGG